MPASVLRVGFLAIAVSAAQLVVCEESQAQVTRGFLQTAPAIASGEELNRQPDLWVMEIQFKQMRMTWVDITDPETGETNREQVWYLAYRTLNRPLATRQQAEEDQAPVIELDPVPSQHRLIPEFVLVTYDDRESEIPERIAMDEVIPEAVAHINQIERRRESDPVYKDPVSIIQHVPDAVPKESDDQPWVYGVATWRGIDPDADFFKVVLKGFSNGYFIRTTGDQPIVWRKVLVQKFLRRGDRFDPNQREFEFDGPAQWDYLPDTPSLTGE
ncbi:hypothetical protein [Maioricimonas rarisocia]|uniref:hypothetical protein n=1 Tax=Maioricimonas rarisocia TaxID=2528026 RepID=UPI0011A2A237|nr:hypothetical protein [Maioricimonas rarisocia]